MNRDAAHTAQALDFDGCLKDADWEVGCGPSCIVQTTDGLRCQEGIVRQKKGLKRMVAIIAMAVWRI